MKQEKTLAVIAIIILVLMIAATVICAVKYMHEEPWWNRDPAPIVTDAPDAGKSPWMDVVTANLPPGRYADAIILHNGGGDSDAAD